MSTRPVRAAHRGPLALVALMVLGTLPFLVSLPLPAAAAVPEPRFSAPVSYPGAFHPESIAVADFTGDGRKDVVANSVWNIDPQNAFKLFLFAQQADGSLRQQARLDMTPYEYPHYVTTLDAGDLDGDGDADVAVATSLGIDVFFQKDGTLGGRTTTGIKGTMKVKVADIDGDGLTDLLATGAGGVSWQRGAGDGTFGAPTTITSVSMPVEVGHLDGDRRLDVVGTSGSTLYVFRQLADGSFTASERTAVPGADLAVGDLNGDGRDDVALTLARNSPSSSVVVWHQRQDGTLAPALFHPVLDIPKPLALADVNGDGRTDVVTLHDGWYAGGLLLQDSDGTLTAERRWDMPYVNYRSQSSLAVDDVTGDGRPDIVYSDGSAIVVMPGEAPAPPPPTSSTSTTTPGPTTSTTRPPPVATDEATTWRIDAAHTGAVSGGTQRPPLAKRWSRHLGGTVSQPLIAGGRVFALAETGRGSPGSTLYAIDAATGKDAWGPIDLGSQAFFSYGDGQLFVLNRDGVLRSFDAATGRQRWIVRSFGSLAPPVYKDGVIHVSARTDSWWAELVALSAADGRELWRRWIVADDAAPAISEHGILTSMGCGPNVMWPGGTGDVLWSDGRDCYGGTSLTPVVAHGLAWIRDTHQGLPVALDARTGETVVTFTADAAPAFDAERGYFLDRGTIEARDPRTQGVHWRFSGDGRLTAAPIVVNGHVYAASSSGRVWALDAVTGAVAWSDNAGAPVLGSREGGTRPLFVGLSAGQGIVAVPASDLLVAYAPASVPPPALAPSAYPAPKATASTAQAPSPSDDASSFRIDGAHQNIVASGIEVPPLRKRWTRDLGYPAEYSVMADGRLFVTAGHRLYALDVLTGADVWQPVVLGPDQAPRAWVSYGEGKVFASFREGPLRAFDAATGTELWSQEFTEYGPEPFEVPTVYDRGVVYALTSKGLVRALSAVTGEQLWKGYLGGGMFGPPSVAGGLVVGGTCGHGLRALDAATGARVWDIPARCTSAGTAQTAVNGGEVWVEAATGTTPMVHDTATGQVLRATSGPLPTFDGSRTFTLEGAALKARDRPSGFTSWTFLGDGQLATAPVSVNGHVYVGSATGKVWALHPATGEPVWSGDAGAPIRSRDPHGFDLGANIAAGQGVVAVPASNLMVAYEAVPGTGARYHSLAPARILDTRSSLGAPAAKVGPGATLGLQVTGRGGVPASGVSAVALNVTVTNPTAVSHLTAWPAGPARPLASNLNYGPGQTVPNMVVVKVGEGGRVNLYNAGGSTDVVVDVAGWY